MHLKPYFVFRLRLWSVVLGITASVLGGLSPGLRGGVGQDSTSAEGCSGQSKLEYWRSALHSDPEGLQVQSFHLPSDGCRVAGWVSQSPIILSIPTGEGSFEICLQGIAIEKNASLTVKAESRRLMLHERIEESDGLKSFRFVVNVRTPEFRDGSKVQLNEREYGVWHWDDDLQIEIHAINSMVTGLHLRPSLKAPVVYLLGDSTVTDQTHEPWAGWGQMLPVFFSHQLVVANHAESGETLRSFRSSRRLCKVMETLNPGDYVFLQFGHNDMKETGEGVGAILSFRDDLLDFIGMIRAHGAQPVLVTPVKRRRFDSDGRQYPSLGEYPSAVRSVAREQQLPLIDLNLTSGVLYSALGPEGSKSIFVHYPAGSFPGQAHELRDDSHFNPEGALLIARMVVEGIRDRVPVLVPFLRPNLPIFDPSFPECASTLPIPASPPSQIIAPAGN